MKLPHTVILLFFVMILGDCYGDNSYTLSGFIKDAASGEDLIGASVTVQNTSLGAAANNYGFYSLSLPKGKYTIVVSYVGYEKIIREVNLDKNTKIDFHLKIKADILQEIKVSGKKTNDSKHSTEMGTNSLLPEEIKNIPVLLGEQDLLKTIQLMPGVKPAGEGINGFYTRGGTNDQNLIILDEAPIYNASHLMGFFSIFNSDAVKSAKLYKGAIPAKYGGRLSSVLDISMKNGDNKQFGASGGIGFIASRLTMEVPVDKGKGSFMVSGRRTYADLFLKMSPNSNFDGTALYFYDLNLKGNYSINHKNRLFVSAYSGRDVFEYRSKMKLNWGNELLTFRWNHIFSDRLFSNTTLLYSNYDYTMTDITETENYSVDIISGIKDLSVKTDFQYYINPQNTLKFGLSAIKHTFTPGRVKFRGDINDNNDKRLSDKDAYEYSAYLSHSVDFSSSLSVNAGLRFSAFDVLDKNNSTPKSRNSYAKEAHFYPETIVDDKEVTKSYCEWEPRIVVNYNTGHNSSLKAGISRNVQYMHLVSNTSAGSPFDIWYPASEKVKPQTADIASLGWYKVFGDSGIDASVETYYKKMNNQIEYKNEADIFMNEDLDNEFVFGKARAYGLELMAEKNKGALTGWIAYTLAKVEKRFEEINDNQWFPAKQDRLHDISIVGNYKINKEWSISANWIYYTGDATTFPTGKYVIADNVVNLYDRRNQNRMPDYHRLDMGITWTPKSKGRMKSWWTFSIYNIYNRQNAFMIYFREKSSSYNSLEAVKISLFSVVPSLTWNFKF